ncbi:hypothetical protein Trydic_g21586 [Trypoxylus dichotomus]
MYYSLRDKDLHAQIFDKNITIPTTTWCFQFSTLLCSFVTEDLLKPLDDLEELSKELKYLEVTLGGKLNWNCHLIKVTDKAMQHFWCCRRIVIEGDLLAIYCNDEVNDCLRSNSLVVKARRGLSSETSHCYLAAGTVGNHSLLKLYAEEDDMGTIIGSLWQTTNTVEGHTNATVILMDRPLPRIPMDNIAPEVIFTDKLNVSRRRSTSLQHSRIVPQTENIRKREPFPVRALAEVVAKGGYTTRNTNMRSIGRHKRRLGVRSVNEIGESTWKVWKTEEYPKGFGITTQEEKVDESTKDMGRPKLKVVTELEHAVKGRRITM